MNVNKSNYDELANVEADLAILSEASRILEASGFTVRFSNLTDARLPWLLAENDLFAVAIVATRVLDDLVKLEPHAVHVLANRIRHGGPKRWDAYLLLMARHDKESRGTSVVREMQYDTSSLRRMVSLGVEGDEDSIRRALRPFLPLPRPADAVFRSSVDSLLDELVLQGIDRNHALQAMQAFEASGGSWS